MKSESDKKNEIDYLIKENGLLRVFSDLISSIINDFYFVASKFREKRLGRFFYVVLAKVIDGIALITGTISKRLERDSSLFPSHAHVLGLFIFIFVTRLLWVVFTHPYATPGALEEQLLELTAAKNFVDYGFMKTFFLPDYVSSKIVKDHPVVYTHMPPLASIIVALLLKVKMDAFGIRLFFISLNTLGLFYGYLFFKKIFNSRVSFVVILLLSINFYQSFEWCDHFDYSMVWLFLFGAAYYFTKFASKTDNTSKWYDTIAFFVIILATSLTSYVILLTQVVLLTLLYVFNIARPVAQYRWLLAVTVIFGVFLHLLQNILFLGPVQFWEEITLTLKNRIYGQPSTFELKSYFFTHNIVNWGAAGFDLKEYAKQFWEYVKAQMLFGRGYGWMLAFLLFYAAGYNIRNNYKKAVYLLKLVIAFWGAAVSWYILFPAHSQGYTIAITGWGVVPAIVMGGVCVLSIEGVKNINQFWRTALIFLMVIMLLVPVFESVKRTISTTKKQYKKSAYTTLSNLEKYSDEVIWTNLTFVYPAYFTNSVVAARCTVDALKKMDISFCDNVLVNSASQESIELLKKPTLFIYSRTHLSGNMREAMPEHLDAFERYLNNNFLLIEVIDNIKIFKIANHPS